MHLDPDPFPGRAPEERTGAGRRSPGWSVPDALLDGVGRTADGQAWLARVPDLVAAARSRWGLTLMEPFGHGSASWCAPGTTPDGEQVVLKISFPHDEARAEAIGLVAWAGRGAVRLRGVHPDDWALLLDRVLPGEPMTAVTGSVPGRLAAGGRVLRSLTAAPLPEGTVGGPAARGRDAAPGGVGTRTLHGARVPQLTDVAAAWALLVAERAERARARSGVPDEAVVRTAELMLRAPSAGPIALVHGDLNPGNVLRDATGGWTAIDPKPLIGDPAFDLWPLVEQVGDPWRSPDPVTALADRTALAARTAGVDPGRAAGWALARSVEAALWDWDVTGDVAVLRAGLRWSGDWLRAWDRITG